MMNSYRRNNGVSKLTAATVLVVVFFAADLISGGRLHAGLRGVLAPVSLWGERAKSAVFSGSWLLSRQTLLKENAALQSEIETLKAHDAAYQALLAEHESLQRLANLARKERGIAAPVMTSFSASPYGTFVIGAGSSAGVQRGAAVLSENGFVLGVVTDVASNSATVRLVLAPAASTDVTVGNVGFTLEGRGGGNGRARVPREAPVRAGDVVIAAMFADRAVGVIGSTQTASSSAYSDVYIRFPMNLNSVRFVYVLKP